MLKYNIGDAVFNIEYKFVPFTDEKYTIDSEGVVRCGGVTLVEKLINGNWCVEIDWYDGCKFYDKYLIYIVSFKASYLPKELYCEIEVCHCADYLAVPFDFGVFYRFRNGPLEIDWFPGFYYIPYYTELAINKKGELFHLEKRFFLPVYLSKPPANNPKNRKLGYASATYKNTNRETRTILRHRAVGFVFLRYESAPNVLVINHLNGVPGDDRPENLEWTTKAKNNQHAIDAGLVTTRLVPVDAKNAFTKEEKSFISFSSAGRDCGFSESLVKLRVEQQAGFVYEDGWLFKKKSEDWVLKDPRIKARNDAGSFMVLVRDVYSETIFVFGSIQDASEYTGIVISSVKERLIKNISRPFKGFIFRYRTLEEAVWPTYTPEDLAVYREYPYSGGIGLYILNDLGVETFYPSTFLAGLTVGYSKVQMDKVSQGTRSLKNLKVRVYRPTY